MQSSLLELSKSNLQTLNQQCNAILPKTGGYDTAINNIKKQVIDQLNEIIRPTPEYRHLSDVFITPQLINRTHYFTNVLKQLDNKQTDVLVNNIYYGTEYLVAIYPETSISYYLSATGHIESKSIESNTNLTKFSLLSVVTTMYPKSTSYIRQVIIDNGKYHTVSNKFNEQNEKFAKMLGMSCVKYHKLNYGNYDKCIKALIKPEKPVQPKLIEFSYNVPFYDKSINRWASHPLPITFFCRKCPSEYATHKDSKTSQQYILFLTINISDKSSLGIKKLPFHDQLFGSNMGGFFQPMQFSPTTYPNAYIYYSKHDLDKKYVDLIWDNELTEWQYIETVDYKTAKQRTNPYGDDYKLSELSLWNNYRNPLTKQDLTLSQTEISKQMYFVNVKTDLHKAPIKMNNFVKMDLIKQNSNTVVDLASGRASDLMNYRNKRIKHLLFCEIDKDAVDIATERQYTMRNIVGTTLNIFNTDLNTPYKANLDIIQNIYNIPNGGVSQINCFFALHYLTNTQDRINNITELISSLLTKGGEFLYTAFDFTAVDKLLTKHNGKWEVSEKNTKKYSIIKEYKTSDIKTTKRAIKLILPFNVNTQYYDENLINDELLDKAFTKHKMKVIDEGSFTNFSDKFKKEKPQFYHMLTDADKLFIGLYKYKVYKKL